MKKSLPSSLSKGRNENKIRVVVAMSGGVDSSVAAALLKKQGFDVVGIFMRFWSEAQNYANQPDAKRYANTCCSEGAEQAARNVAVKIGVPFYVLRVEKEFKKSVVDYFLEEQKRGRTPNPCVVCNKKIKFGLMMERALAMGADFVVTGHYVCLKKIKNEYKLFKGKDPDKDQSYFLYTLTQKQLSRVLFPLGGYKKEQVYQMAKKWRLPYRKEESFDLCFVGKDTGSFIGKHLELKKGKVMNLTGRFLGEHSGLAYYTIGQRKNLPLRQGPWWVVKKDYRKNILYVSSDEKDLYNSEVLVGDINWMNGQPPRLRQGYGGQAKLPMKVWAKIRYKSEAAEAQIAKSKSKITVKFKKPQRAPTPGQSVVFYSKSGEVLGGGTIEK